MDPIGGIIHNSSYGSSTVAAEPASTTSSNGQDKRTDTTAAPTASTGVRLPEDQVTLSGQQQQTDKTRSSTTDTQTSAKDTKAGEKTTTDGTSLEDPQVKEQISRLKQIEEKVKSHEAAHKAAGGGLAGSASYSYTQGPDGRSYVTGGEVQINMSDGRTPDETISRMQQVIQAALAPSDPSGQDRSVAAQAASRMAQAQQEKTQSASSTTAGSNTTSSTNPADKATNKTAGQGATTGVSPNSKTTDSRIQQAYGNPAVQGNSGAATGVTASNRQPQDASSLISSFA